MANLVYIKCQCGEIHRVADPGRNVHLRCRTSGVEMAYACYSDDETYRLRGPERDLILGRDRITIGRAPGNHLVVQHPGISRDHCALTLREEGYLIEDLGSSNGTFLNETKLETGRKYRLRPGMLIRLGKTFWRYLVPRSVYEQDREDGEAEEEGRDEAAPATGTGAEVVGTDTAAVEAVDPLLGQVFGRFRLDKVLAQGGMGRIYQAADEETGHLAAVKTILPEVAPGPDIIERFQREIEMTARLSHSNIIDFYEAGQAGRHLFLAIEFFEGKPLSRCFRKRPASPAVACRIGLQIASALAHAHGENIIHRDMKPDNILTDRQANIKVLDFGVAKLTQDDDFSSLTMSGAAVGTPAYMAPEQMSDPKGIDHRIDIYGLGATLFFCLTGKAPYEGQSLVGIFRALQAGPPDIRELRPDVPPELRTVLARSMATKRDERYATAEEFIAALGALNL